MSEIDELKRRISELEDGACRFNCRKEREAFKEGWRRAGGHVDTATHFRLSLHETTWGEEFRKWLKERDDA